MPTDYLSGLFGSFFQNEQGKWQPERLTLWQRIKKHGWYARIF